VPNTMRAFRMQNWQEPPALDEIDVPEPGPGEIRIKVAGNGLCHSDLHMAHVPAALGKSMGWKMPFTLGHEVGGWIDKLGSDPSAYASKITEGQPVAIVSTRVGRGYGMDGGIADYLILENDRPLIPLAGLDPRLAGPFTDAGTTSYHAVARVKDKLTLGRTVLVIGAGGLGGFAVQYLKLLTSSRILVTDIDDIKRRRAKEMGADVCLDAAMEGLSYSISSAATRRSPPASPAWPNSRALF